MFNAQLSSQSEKFLQKLSKRTRERLIKKIQSLEANPFPQGIDTVKSKTGKTTYRVRVGTYRIQYVVFAENKEILIFKIEKRSRAY